MGEESTGEQGLDWRTPSARLGTLRRAEAVALTCVLLAAGLAAGAAGGGRLGAVSGAAVAVAAGLFTDRVLRRRVRSWGYAERSEDLLVRRGVMFHRLSVIPYGRMQFVDVTAGPLERAFGLATVKMHTAAAASDARIPGLAAADASALRDRFSALGESQASGL